MWRPWERHRREMEAANRRVAVAEQRVHEAEGRRREAHRQAAQSFSVTDALLGEIQENGWTKLLQRAWGR